MNGGPRVLVVLIAAAGTVIAAIALALRSREPEIPRRVVPSPVQPQDGIDRMPDSVAAWLPRLRSPSRDERRAGWTQLKALAGGDMAGYVTGLLDAELDRATPDHRGVVLLLTGAFAILGEQGVLETVPDAFRRCLRDGSTEIRRAALVALRRIPDSTCQQDVLGAMQDPNLFDAAVRALPLVWDGTDDVPRRLLASLKPGRALTEILVILESLAEVPYAQMHAELERFYAAACELQDIAYSMAELSQMGDQLGEAQATAACMQHDPSGVLERMGDNPRSLENLALMRAMARKLPRNSVYEWLEMDPANVESPHFRVCLVYLRREFRLPLKPEHEALLSDTVLLD